MVSDSRGFSECMVKKAFSYICKKDILKVQGAVGLVERLSNQFESSGYLMKSLMLDIASDESCI